MNETGYVYCLSNPSFAESMYKIGFTKNNPYMRARQLNTTGVPTPFKVEMAKRVCNYRDKEIKIHKFLAKYRVNNNREFFNIALSEIKNIFDLMDGRMCIKPELDSDSGSEYDSDSGSDFLEDAPLPRKAVPKPEQKPSPATIPKPVPEIISNPVPEQGPESAEDSDSYAESDTGAYTQSDASSVNGKRYQYKCHKCDKSFHTRYLHNRHQNKKIPCNHAELLNYKNIKKRCVYCSKLLGTYDSARYHMNICKHKDNPIPSANNNAPHPSADTSAPIMVSENQNNPAKDKKMDTLLKFLAEIIKL